MDTKSNTSMIATLFDKTTAVSGTGAVLGLMLGAPDPKLVDWVAFTGQCFGTLAAAGGFIYVCVKIYYKVKLSGRDGDE